MFNLLYNYRFFYSGLFLVISLFLFVSPFSVTTPKILSPLIPSFLICFDVLILETFLSFFIHLPPMRKLWIGILFFFLDLPFLVTHPLFFFSCSGLLLFSLLLFLSFFKKEPLFLPLIFLPVLPSVFFYPQFLWFFILLCFFVSLQDREKAYLIFCGFMIPWSFWQIYLYQTHALSLANTFFAITQNLIPLSIRFLGEFSWAVLFLFCLRFILHKDWNPKENFPDLGIGVALLASPLLSLFANPVFITNQIFILFTLPFLIARAYPSFRSRYQEFSNLQKSLSFLCFFLLFLGFSHQAHLRPPSFSPEIVAK